VSPEKPFGWYCNIYIYIYIYTGKHKSISWAEWGPRVKDPGRNAFSFHYHRSTSMQYQQINLTAVNGSVIDYCFGVLPF